MTIEQIVERMDVRIELLTESIQEGLILTKGEVKELFGSVKTYKECVAMERGALTALISFRQWIVNNKNK